MIILISLFLLFPCIFPQQTTPDGCFERWPNSLIACQTVFGRIAPTNEKECLGTCASFQPHCTAAVFDSRTQRCQIYDNVRVNGRYGRQYSRRSLRNGMRSRCKRGGPRVLNCPNYVMYKPTGNCKGGFSTQGPNTPSTRSTTERTTTTTTEEPTTETEEPLPEEATCPRGQEVRFMQIEGFKLSGNPDFEFAADSQEDCIQACADNRSPDGEQAPCRSAQYHTRTGICELSLEAALPNGNGELNPSPNSIYMEKICIDQALVRDCPGPFKQVPQGMLVGFAETVTDAVDLQDCLVQCLDAQEMFGFKCRSGMVFYEEETFNCILNIETEETQPQLFTTTGDDIVDYFEPGCLARKRSRLMDSVMSEEENMLSRTSQWGPWTHCDPRKSKKARFRNCDKPVPSTCQIKTKGCKPKQASKGKQIKSNDVPKENRKCNALKECCALLEVSGKKDCKRGRQLTKQGLQPCKPVDC